MENNQNSFLDEREYVQPKLIVLMRCVSAVIIILNITVLACLLKGKRTFPHAYWYQIVCITCNDLLAGLSSFLMSFVDWDFFGESIAVCSVTVGLFFVTQCATLYNILAICISRFVVLKGLKQSKTPWKKVHTIYGTLAAWTISSLLCSTPFVIWSDAAYFSKFKFCSMKGIFDDHVSSAMKILLGSFLIPLVLTDVIYSLVFFVLKNDLRVLPATASLGPAESTTSIQMSQSRDDNTSPRHSSNGNCGDDNNDKITFRCQSVQTEVSMTTFGIHNGPISESCINLQTCEPMPANSNSRNVCEATTDVYCNERRSSEHNNAKPDANLTESLVSTRRKSHSVTVPILRIRKAFMLLGLILIALNIVTWPGLIALLLGSMLDSVHFSRSLILPLFATLSLNSVVNPILYTVRVPEFRDAFYCTFFPSCYKKKRSSRNKFLR